MKIKPIYVVNIVFIALIIALLFTPLRGYLQKIQSSTAESKYAKISQLTPEQYNIELKGVNTPDVNFKDFKGKKIFLNFWATWCPICKSEMPDIQTLYNSSKQDYQFVLIYMKDDRKKVEEYLKENSYTFPVYEAVSPIETSLLPTEYPTTFLIKENGEIQEKVIGARDWKNLKF
ncbi:TlpA family protein disulfide reductase [Apibacter muscae]|uniref:TlpA family protein disulfide reductase n=1 Tax=Apibacter muscae TaxID=2509004 RepID=A0A563D7V1_9FLAO|nr:TlpA disulfide reductase family protein [Apibacter muscae]TWP22968.1 TlpA family protein disulfide reductase [Apibacter muscae]TWP26149.1 TlpA family protein disulfide reductase [Apibacter muscae]